jgi:hypothetical protein
MTRSRCSTASSGLAASTFLRSRISSEVRPAPGAEEIPLRPSLATEVARGVIPGLVNPVTPAGCCNGARALFEVAPEGVDGLVGNADTDAEGMADTAPAPARLRPRIVVRASLNAFRSAAAWAWADAKVKL